MLKINTLIILMFFSCFVTKVPAATMIEKAKARIILMKTNRAIGVAHITVKRTKKFTGKLGNAVKHARFAKKLYEAGNFDQSAYHSLFARKLAAEVMKENNAKMGSDYLFSADENALIGKSNSDDALIKEVTTDNAVVLTDEELMRGSLSIEVL